MYLIAGLGNIGMKYSNTRHNLGFLVVDHLLQANLENRLKVIEDEDTEAYVLKKLSDGENEFLAMKALGFMNLSGRPIATVMKRYDIAAENLVVVHDDLDLEPGDVKIKFGGGSGGHNGLRSIIEEIATGDLLRVRLGIGRPPGKKDPSDFVLEQYTSRELHDVAFQVMEAVDAVKLIISQGPESAMNQVNGRERDQ